MLECCILVIVNNSVMNTGMHVSFPITVLSSLQFSHSVMSHCKFSSDKYPGVKLLDHMLVLFLFFFWEICILFSIMAVPLHYHLQFTMAPFPHILACTVFFLICLIQPLWQGRGDISWLWFAFPWWLIILSIFSYACWSSVRFLGNIFRSSIL